jgi:hypothetical protein
MADVFGGKQIQVGTNLLRETLVVAPEQPEHALEESRIYS